MDEVRKPLESSGGFFHLSFIHKDVSKAVRSIQAVIFLFLYEKGILFFQDCPYGQFLEKFLC
ncbi:hypothetical protein J2Z66_001958 [Paenibacillus eucommiae]|uniref:Uncharacterized protein n=1 Tax=Paenibacillus eucommiae TaxID=1355755 RepID=A0ABS4IS14_9BACL|nr:hypothetical protein [Paenibacillus eucommiae]